MKIKEYRIKKYIDILASNASMPGGGSVSAIAGAEGVSLILMVCNLSLGKEKYKKYQKLIKNTIKECEKIKEKFIYLIDEDIKTFKYIEKAFKMSKNTEEDKKKRKNEMEKACKKCCVVPVETIKLCLESLICAKKVIGKTNKSAESDIGIAAINLATAAKGAEFNILINIKSINDKKYITKIRNFDKLNITKIKKLEKEIVSQITKEINEKNV